jgi:hypothetical protein
LCCISAQPHGSSFLPDERTRRPEERKRESYRVVVLAVSALQTSIQVLNFNEANLHSYVEMPLPNAIPNTTSMNHGRGVPPRRTFLVLLMHLLLAASTRQT